jgi:uncharacterized membrane protein (DUF4010 family)
VNDTWIGLAVALGVGLLVGLDRERRKGQGPQREAAGLRTFALVTVAGALAQSLAPGLLVAVGALAVAALAVVAYWRSQQVPLTQSDPGLTTEVALVVAYLVGVQCAVQPAVGAACGAVLAALLAARERMHRFATEWLTDEELRDALVLAGVALVVVPLAPTTPLPGLGGLAPRTAAWLVLVILSLQAAAHIAQRLFGERHALMAAGLLGGFVSSTATIATFGARVHSASTTMRPRLAAAASLSAVATWLQALVMAAVVSPELLPRLAPVALAGALGAFMVGARRSRDEPSDPATTATASKARPLRLREAFAVASLLLVVSIVMGWLEAKFGRQGLFAGSALAALADAHAPIAAAFSLHAQGTIDAGAAVQVLVLAVAVNSASRCVVALVAGGIGYAARVGAALLVSVLAAVLGLMLAARLITFVA